MTRTEYGHLGRSIYSGSSPITDPSCPLVHRQIPKTKLTAAPYLCKTGFENSLSVLEMTGQNSSLGLNTSFFHFHWEINEPSWSGPNGVKGSALKAHLPINHMQWWLPQTLLSIKRPRQQQLIWASALKNPWQSQGDGSLGKSACCRSPVTNLITGIHSERKKPTP